MLHAACHACRPTPPCAGPLSEAAADEANGCGGPGRERGGGKAGLAQAGQQQQGGEEDEEGDNRSFYGSDSQVWFRNMVKACCEVAGGACVWRWRVRRRPRPIQPLPLLLTCHAMPPCHAMPCHAMPCHADLPCRTPLAT